MIDDLGAEAIAAYGGKSYRTPNIDRLATEGMMFENAFAQPMCMISRATLMSGRYGFRSGLPENIDVPQKGWSPKDNLREAETQKWSKPNYKSMVEYTDKLIGRVAAKIEELGISENTLLIVTADNGSIPKAINDCREQTIRGGKGSAFDAGIRAPFIAVWKGKIVAGAANANLIDFTDVLPTLVGLGGGKLREDRYNPALRPTAVSRDFRQKQIHKSIRISSTTLRDTYRISHGLPDGKLAAIAGGHSSGDALNHPKK